MNTIFIHISDLHCKEYHEEEIAEKIQNFVQTIVNQNCKNAIFLLGGDLSNSGSEVQYARILEFCENLSLELKKSNVLTTFLCVPGNHDLQYKEGYVRGRDEIRKLTHKDMIKNFSKETRKLDNFYTFQEKLYELNKNHSLSFVEEDSTSRYLSHHILTVEEVTYDIYTLNNCMYSYFDKDEKYMDNEKGIFQLIHDYIEKICRKSKYSILLMHFPIEYFRDDTRKLLLKKTRGNIDLILSGHLHEEYASSSKYKNRETQFLQAGAFSDHSSATSSFSILLVSEAVSKYKTYEWNNVHKCYKNDKNLSIDLIPYEFVFDNLEHNEDYFDDFYYDTQNLFKNVLDYFVFPQLSFTNLYEDVDYDSIIDFESFIKVFSDYKVFVIEGDETSGKTTLLKYFFKKLSSTNLILYANNYDMKKTKKPELLVKNLLLEEYDNVIPDTFYKYNINQRILIIDDGDEYLDRIDQLKLLFGKIIITVSRNPVRRIIDIVKANEFNPEDTILFELHKFYKAKRTKLAENVYRAINSKNGDKVSNNQVNKFTKQFNRILETHLPLFGLNPLNIFYLVYHLSINNTQDEKNIYNEVFASNLNMQIKRSSDYLGLKDYRPYGTVTQKLAFEMNQKKSSFFTISKISKVIEEYNESYNQKVNVQKYLELMKHSKILIEPEDNKYYFNNKNFLAYFASKEYVYKSNYYNENEEIFNELFNNIYEGINDKILLFLAFSQQNNRIIDSIITKAKSNFCELEEIKIDKCKILTNTQEEINKIDFASEEFKAEQLKLSEKREMSIVSGENANKYNVYQNTFNSFQINYQTSVKLIELIATILPNFSHHLHGDTQFEMIDLLYALPNKLLQWRFQEMEENFDVIIELLYNKLNKDFNLEEYSPNKIKTLIIEAIVNVVRAVILSTYDGVARISMDIATDEMITDKKRIHNNTNLIQNLMFKSFSDNDPNNERFKRDAMHAYKSHDVKKNNMLKNSIKLIVRRFVNDSDIVPLAAKGIDNLFLEAFYGKDYRSKFIE